MACAALSACAGAPEAVAPEAVAPTVAEAPQQVESPPPASVPSSLPALVAASPFDDRLPPPPEATEHKHAPWPFHVEHYDIALSVNAASHSIHGDVTIDVEDRADGLEELPLDAVGFEIESVEEVGPPRRDAAYTYDGHVLKIALEEPRRSGNRREFVVSYSAEPKRGLYFNDGPPWQVYTQGEMEDSRYWYPCHDSPDDRSTSRVVVNAPNKWLVVAPGRPQGRPNHLGGRAESAWAMDVPHVSYLTSVVTGEYETIEEKGVVPLWYCVEKDDAPYAAFDFRKTNDVLTFFGDYTGLPYPYSKYAQTCVRHFMFGGMENISATTLTDRTIHPPEWEPVHTSTSLVAHEAAHQWFGDWITCCDWSHAWLNEGFATYFDLLFTEHDEGRDAFLWALRGTRHGALGAMDHKRRPLVSSRYVVPDDLFDGNAYPGGAARLHMLRHELGDDAFREAIRHYVKTCAQKCVTTDDFEKAVEESSGRDLKWFFDQWFKKPGYPVLKVRWKWDEARNVEIVTVEQTQKGRDTPEAYSLSLDVTIGGEPIPGPMGLQATDFDMTRRLHVTKRSETFELRAVGRPREIRVDPHSALLARFDVDLSIDDLASELAHDPNVARRADAAEALAGIVRDEKRAAADRERAGQALLLAFRDETFNPLRAAIAFHVAGRKEEAAANMLVAAMEADSDLRVRLAATSALAGFEKNDKVRAALVARLDDASDLVRAEATSSLARMKVAGAYDLVLAQVERPGWSSVVRDAALRGLGEIGDERALPTLVRFAAPGDRFARGAAFEALGRLGKGRPAVRDVVLPYLDDPERDVRAGAAWSLGAMADPDVIPILAAHFQTETWPGCRDAMRHAIQSCRAAAVDSGRLVTVEAKRAAELRERHAVLRSDADAVEKSLKDLAGDAKTQAETRLKSLRDQMGQTRRDLDALGVPVEGKTRAK